MHITGAHSCAARLLQDGNAHRAAESAPATTAARPSSGNARRPTTAPAKRVGDAAGGGCRPLLQVKGEPQCAHPGPWPLALPCRCAGFRSVAHYQVLTKVAGREAKRAALATGWCPPDLTGACTGTGNLRHK